MAGACPVCGGDLVAFSDLDPDLRDALEAAPDRGYQSVEHRRERHAVCPECTFEVHGCGQPYAVPDAAVE